MCDGNGAGRRSEASRGGVLLPRSRPGFNRKELNRTQAVADLGMVEEQLLKAEV